MLALKNMNNRQFNEALGAELTHLSCNYYGIFQDVLPIHWKRDFFESRSEDLMNLSVEFGSAQKAQAAFGNIISPGLVCAISACYRSGIFKLFFIDILETQNRLEVGAN